MTCLLALQNHKAHITLNDYTSLNVTRQCKASSPKKLLQESIIYSCKIFPLIGGNILSQIKSWDVSFMDIVLIWIQDYCSRVFINLDNLKYNLNRYRRYFCSGQHHSNHQGMSHCFLCVYLPWENMIWWLPFAGTHLEYVLQLPPLLSDKTCNKFSQFEIFF